MEAAAVLTVLADLRGTGIKCWVDGGWGVDALLGRQTRDHNDLDLVVRADVVADLRARFTDSRFAVERDWLPAALALRHPDGHAVDLHPIKPTADGGGDQIQLDGSRWHYTVPATGTIPASARKSRLACLPLASSPSKDYRC